VTAFNAFAKRWLTFLGKEIWIESRYPVPLFQNLIISPLVTALPLFLVFKKYLAIPGSEISGWHAGNVETQIGVGLLCHFCLNSGCYLLFNRLIGEWHHNTLGLLWFSPRPRFLSLLLPAVMDGLRAMLFSILILGVFFSSRVEAWEDLLILLVLGLFFLLGSFFGVFRFVQHVLNPRGPDFGNLVYLFLLFTSGIYLPIGVLPSALAELSRLNPFFYGKQFIVRLIEHEFSVAALAEFLVSPIFLGAALWLLLQIVEEALGERCVKS
jgi:hypothetical protein